VGLTFLTSAQRRALSLCAHPNEVSFGARMADKGRLEADPLAPLQVFGTGRSQT
jgi:hypothetical protein